MAPYKTRPALMALGNAVVTVITPAINAASIRHDILESKRTLERRRLVNQHDRNVVAHRVPK